MHIAWGSEDLDVEVWAGGRYGFDLELTHCADDLLNQLALALRTRAAGNQHTRSLRGPWRVPRFGPARLVEQRADIAKIGRQPVGLEVESPAHRQQHPRGPI